MVLKRIQIGSIVKRKTPAPYLSSATKSLLFPGVTSTAPLVLGSFTVTSSISGMPKRLLEAYEDSIRESYGYLVVNNLTGSGDEDIRLSACILPGEDLILYFKR